jgi:hypothetical protein
VGIMGSIVDRDAAAIGYSRCGPAPLVARRPQTIVQGNRTGRPSLPALPPTYPAEREWSVEERSSRRFRVDADPRIERPRRIVRGRFFRA